MYACTSYHVKLHGLVCPKQTAVPVRCSAFICFNINSLAKCNWTYV